MNDYKNIGKKRKKKRDQTEYTNMYELPDKNQRLIIVNTEVSGVTCKDNVIEICTYEIINDRLTGKKYHKFFKPQNYMTEGTIKEHSIPKSVFLTFLLKIDMLWLIY